MEGRLFLVTRGHAHMILNARDREHAKRHSRQWLGGDTDTHLVTPLTDVGDHVFIHIYEKGAKDPGVS